MNAIKRRLPSEAEEAALEYQSAECCFCHGEGCVDCRLRRDALERFIQDEREERRCESYQ